MSDIYIQPILRTSYCLLVLTALDIPSVWNGTVTDFTGSVEDNLPIIVATVICNSGFYLNGSETLALKALNFVMAWNGSSPVCILNG